MVNKKGQSGSVYLFFLMFLLIPILIYFAVPLLGTVGGSAVTTQGLTGVIGLIFDNLNFILFLCFVLFIVLWAR